VERCLDAYRKVADEAGTEPEEPDGALPLSYWLGARIDFGAEIKQEILELSSERERVVRLTELLDRARETISWSRMARDRAQTNGRVEPPE